MIPNKFHLIFILLLSLLLLVSACSGGDDEPTSTLTSKPNVTVTGAPSGTSTTAPTPSPTISESPIKIGAITSWSGPMSISGLSLCDPIIKLVEWQVKQEGGILGGREVKVVRYDNRASVAEAAAGAQKLMIDDKVSALTLGGTSGAESAAIAEFAEKNHILYILFGAMEVKEPKYTLSASFSYEGLMGPMADLLIKVLHPKTAAYMCVDLNDGRERAKFMKSKLEPAGIATLAELYIPTGTIDMSAYVTQIRAKDPDFLWVDGVSTEFFMNVMMAFQNQGGWSDTIVASNAGAEQAKAKAGAQGVYCTSLWAPGLPYPGSTKFQQEYTTVNDGKSPNPSQVYYYNCFWTAIEAIKLAGTDTDLEKIANMARFSGQLEWETPMGRAHYTAESGGYPQLNSTITQIVDKQLVAVDVPE